MKQLSIVQHENKMTSKYILEVIVYFFKQNVTEMISQH